MKLAALAFGVLMAFIGMTVFTAPAQAQATRTWISGVGDDANPCSRTAPCTTFAGAISKTAAGGEIDCLDPGGFGAVTITKAITLDCASGQGGQVGSILVSGTNGITIAGTSAGTPVTIRNLSINGIAASSSSAGLNGISLGSGAMLHVEHVVISGFGHNGINFTPNAASLLTVDDTIITDNNGGTTGYAGIYIAPTSSANGSVTIANTHISNGVIGIFADGSGGTAGIVHVDVSNSVITKHSNNGISISGGSSAFDGIVTNSLISYSNVAGAGVAGGSSSLTLGNDTIVNNITGVGSVNGGTLFSFKNNQITNNASNGTPITAVPGYSGTLQ